MSEWYKSVWHKSTRQGKYRIPALKVTRNMASELMSIAMMPCEYGWWIIFTGEAVLESQITIMDSSPLSAVAIQRLSLLTHTEVIGLHYRTRIW